MCDLGSCRDARKRTCDIAKMLTRMGHSPFDDLFTPVESNARINQERSYRCRQPAADVQATAFNLEFAIRRSGFEC